MVRNKNIWLGALFFAQVLLIGLLYRPGGGGKTAAKLLPGFSAAAASNIEISDSDKNRVELVKNDGVWLVRLKDKSLYPAAADKVGKLLDKMAALGAGRLVSNARAARRRLEVAADHFNRRIKIRSGTAASEIFLGTSPGYRKVHIRRGDADGIYLVRDLAAWEISPRANAWWQRKYLDYDPAGVTRIRLNNSHGGLSLSRVDGKSPWQTEKGKPLDQEKIKSLVNELCRLSITDLVVDHDFRPTGGAIATLNISGRDGEVKLSVWDREKKNGDYTVKLGRKKYYARAAAYALDRLLAADIAGFYRQEKDEEVVTSPR